METAFNELKQENSRLLREELSRDAFAFQALPEIVTLNHTNACNLTCEICPRSRGGPAETITESALKRVTRSLFPTALKAVLTMAGEPLLSDFDFLLSEALHFGVRLDLFTNGLLLTPERYRSVRDPLDHLNLSLDSHIPEVYEKLRRGGSFEQIYANLSGLRELRRREPDDVLYSISAVVLRSNIESLADFVRFAAWAGADGVLLQRLRHDLMNLEEHDPESAYSRQEMNAFLEEAGKAAQETGINLLRSDIGMPDVMVKPLRLRVPEPVENDHLCSFLAQNFIVLFNGDVYPCCIPTDHYLGNVHEQDPLKIWNSPAFIKLRKDHVIRKGTVFCSGCSQAPYLSARRPAWFNEGLKKTRRLVCHLRRKAARKTF
ncbi:MAG: radical SAM protein [Planctomycetota bacterium]